MKTYFFFVMAVIGVPLAVVAVSTAIANTYASEFQTAIKDQQPTALTSLSISDGFWSRSIDANGRETKPSLEFGTHCRNKKVLSIDFQIGNLFENAYVANDHPDFSFLFSRRLLDKVVPYFAQEKLPSIYPEQYQNVRFRAP